MNEDKINSFYIEGNLFRIRYASERKYTEMKNTHFHDNYEIYYMLNGKKLYFINDKLYKAEKGDLVIVNPYDVHRTSSIEKSEAERILINFKYEFIEELIKSQNITLLPLEKGSGKITLNVREQLQIESILNSMLKECEAKEYGYIPCVRAKLFTLLINISRFSSKLEQVEETPPSLIEQKVLDVVSYICSNFQREITLDSIAKEFYVSPSYLSRIFKKVTGFHMSEYIQITRIREAQKLLRETDSKVIEIAEKVGFRQIAHFNKTFRKITNTTPLKYRKNMR
jgi:AraC-like DNA-binding protein